MAVCCLASATFPKNKDVFLLYFNCIGAIILSQMKLIPLTRGKFAQVDDDDFERLSKFRWHAAPDGATFYAARGIRLPGNRTEIFRMHRDIMNPPSGMMVDHIDHDGLNNQKSNLRSCTKSQNMRNRRGAQKNSKSGYRGVVLQKRTGRWLANIQFDGKLIFLGTYDSILDAASSYSTANKKYFGEFGGSL